MPLARMPLARMLLTWMPLIGTPITLMVLTVIFRKFSTHPGPTHLTATTAYCIWATENMLRVVSLLQS
jgi:hypothetical protein